MKQASLFDHEPETVAFSDALKVTPRDYQLDGILRAFELFDDGCKGVMFRQPTGTGKTISGCCMADAWNSRGDDYKTIILSHERQLVWQFAQEIEDVFAEGVSLGIEMESQHLVPDEMPDIVVASRASLYQREVEGETTSRLYKFDRHINWLVIIDEAHRWRRNLPSCRHIVDWFESNPESRRIGLTATPERGDKVSLEGLFPGIASDYRLYDPGGGRCALRDGWSVPYDQRFITVESIDFTNLKEVAGDFDDEELELRLTEKQELIRLIDPMMDMVGHRRTLIFSPTVAMAKKVAHQINAEVAKRKKDGSLPKGVWGYAEALDGSVPAVVRKSVYQRHQTDDFQFLSVCGLCVAKDSLILTDHGEVPIQNVTTDMRVWDGVEFVSHDGVISKGNRPVVEYAGLKATEDHNVWTDDGWKTMAECKKEGLAIAVSGIEGNPVRESDRYFRTDDREGRAASPGGHVRRLREDDDSSVLPLSPRGFEMPRMRVSPTQPQQRKSSARNRSVADRESSVRPARSHEWRNRSSWLRKAIWHGSSMHWLREIIYETVDGVKNGESWLQKLRKKIRNTVVAALPMQGSQAKVYERLMSRLQRLWRSRHQNEVCFISGDGTLDHGELGPAERHDDRQDRQQRKLRTRQHSVCVEHRSGQQPETETEEVYDILNAGPRHRFTANGLIVSNCREGYNDPGIGAVAVFRPTKSRSLAEQMKGRGCRPLRGILDGLDTAAKRRAAIKASSKPNCLIIDLVGVTGLPDTATTAHIMAAGLPDRVIDEVNKGAAAAAESGDPFDMAEEIEKAKKWDDEERARAKKIRELQEQLERELAQKRAKLDADTTYHDHRVKQGHGAQAAGTPKKKQALATSRQVKFMRNYGLPINPDKCTKKQAGRICGQIQSGMTVEQILHSNKGCFVVKTENKVGGSPYSKLSNPSKAEEPSLDEIFSTLRED